MSLGQPGDAGRAFFESLTAADFAACEFHTGDWRAIVRACGDVFGSGAQDDDAAILEAARALDQQSALWFVSLFHDPIAWGRGQEELANGQHRLCALRATGSWWCPVDLG